MCRIVFWNVNRKDLTSAVCDLVTATNADILILNECLQPIKGVLKELNASAKQSFYVPKYSKKESRFHCLCRIESMDLKELHNGFRTSIRRLMLAGVEVIFGLIHGPDLRNYDEMNRTSLARDVMDEIQYIKDRRKHDRVILLGDFNLNPFDPAMNLAAGYNAMMTRDCIRGGQRTFGEKEYDFYYNPMWSLLGDGSEGPAGTVYDTSGQGPYGWSLFDQVLLSHSVVDRFKRVQILTHAGELNLIDSRGRPNSDIASDHLPILVELEGDSHG